MKSLLSLKERCNRSLLSSSGIRNWSFVIRNWIGFTLVELMIVIAIIGVLAASLFPMMSNYMAKSRDTARMAAVKQMNTAIFSYYQDTGRYPTAGGIGNATRNSTGSINSTGSEWKHDTTKPNNLWTQIAQMMPNMPTDPISTNAYVYWYVYDGWNNGWYYRLYADYERAASEKWLVWYWDMSTLTGSLLRDMSGNGNDGSNVGSSSANLGWSSGKVWQSTTFWDDQTVATKNFRLPEWSISLWMKTTNVSIVSNYLIWQQTAPATLALYGSSSFPFGNPK